MNDLDPGIGVYLVDDDQSMLQALTQSFELDGLDVNAIRKPAHFAKQLDRSFPGIVVTDVRMPKTDGFELFREIQSVDPEIPVIFITGHADVPMVLNALRDGAFDFFAKPIDIDNLLASARRAIETRRLVLENRNLKLLAQKALEGTRLIGETPVMQKLRDTISQVAPTGIDVLIEGEIGTGKEVTASLIHQLSGRAIRKFVTVNCAALPDAVAEEQLFGISQPTQALSLRERMGRIEASHNGTLLFDEIESLSTTLQGQLLPVIENRAVTMVGAKKAQKVDLRIIASSAIDLSEAVARQEFRADLLYRLNTVKLRLPPLRDRVEDIPLLFSHFVSIATEKFNKNVPKMTASSRRRLLDYDWPGNVRELKNFADSVVLGIDDSNGKRPATHHSLPERVERFEANTICSVLESTGGDVRSSVEILGIPRKTFYDKLTRHNINIKKYRTGKRD